jgi:hypothetical protein
MNPNDPRHPWARLTAAARQVQDERDASTPYGFATRVAALAYSQPMKAASLFDAFALRALGVAALLAVFSVAMNYNTLTTTAPAQGIVADGTIPNEELSGPILPTTDALAVVMDIAD